jgi:hypothetical protein
MSLERGRGGQPIGRGPSSEAGADPRRARTAQVRNARSLERSSYLSAFKLPFSRFPWARTGIPEPTGIAAASAGPNGARTQGVLIAELLGRLRTKRRAASAAVAVASVAMGLPVHAQASYDPLASATTTITIAAPLSHLLATHGVSLSATAPARRRGSSLTLPLAGGQVDPIASRLSLESEGTLIFTRGPRRVILRHLSLKTNPTPLIAKVGGGQLKIATSAKRSFARQGFGSHFTAQGLRLTAKLATRLDKKLRLPGVFAQDQLLGSLSATVQPATTAILPVGRLTLTPDPAMLAKLNSLFVSLNPIAPAELAPGPSFGLPFIPAGTIAPDASSGVPRSGGSLEFLQLGAGQLFLHELWFDLGEKNVLAEVDEEPTPTYPGKLGQIPVATLDLSSATIATDPKPRTVSVSGASLSLNPTLAAAFNEAFAKPQGKSDVFHAGELFGGLSFVARGQ